MPKAVNRRNFVLGALSALAASCVPMWGARRTAAAEELVPYPQTMVLTQVRGAKNRLLRSDEVEDYFDGLQWNERQLRELHAIGKKPLVFNLIRGN